MTYHVKANIEGKGFYVVNEDGRVVSGTLTWEEANDLVQENIRADKVPTLNNLANAIADLTEEDIDRYWEELFPSNETEDK
jgi:hypothetical protein